MYVHTCFYIHTNIHTSVCACVCACVYATWKLQAHTITSSQNLVLSLHVCVSILAFGRCLPQVLHLRFT